MARKGNPISVRLDLNRSSDSSRFSESTIHASIFFILLSLTFQNQLKKGGISLPVVKHGLLLIFILLLSIFLMNELYNAVVPFLAKSGDSGINPLPGPSDQNSIFPLIEEGEVPSESQPKINRDPEFCISFQNACNLESEISEIMETLLHEKGVVDLSQREIKREVEGFLSNVWDMEPIPRNRRLTAILKSLRSRGVNSRNFKDFEKHIKNLPVLL
uniref:Uncharacterized protein n=1 Tax=Helianthus annuus TaxID=4232 RepID=A0A3G5AVG7_HELAN|nr:hypothetical protein [Helianthus annuus]